MTTSGCECSDLSSNPLCERCGEKRVSCTVRRECDDCHSRLPEPYGRTSRRLLGLVMRARCADGPYAGQTFEFPRPALHWTPDGPVGPLMWLRDGTDAHCYRLRENRRYGGFRLVFADTF